MAWYEILITSLVSGGILIYLLDRIFFRKRDHAENKAKEIENSSATAHLYEEIDAIVERKTAPILAELTDIKTHWCCYRRDCDRRQMYIDCNIDDSCAGPDTEE